MKTIHFKVRSVYSKKDMVRMQKLATQKNRRRTLTALCVVLFLYIALMVLTAILGGENVSLVTFIPTGTLDIILVAAMIFAIILMIISPYLRANKIIKETPGGEMKAVLYFYDQTFKFGWGNSFSTIAYMEVEVFRKLEDAFYIKAGDRSFWVKKADFEVGDPDGFYPFMEEKTPRAKKR